MHPETGEGSGRQWAIGVEREKEREKGKKENKEAGARACVHVCVFMCMCSESERTGSNGPNRSRPKSASNEHSVVSLTTPCQASQASQASSKRVFHLFSDPANG